jgi:hypothetical protein
MRKYLVYNVLTKMIIESWSYEDCARFAVEILNNNSNSLGHLDHYDYCIGEDLQNLLSEDWTVPD